MQESVAKIELYGLFLHVPMQFKKATVIMEGQESFNEMVQGIETWETLDSQNVILLLLRSAW